MIGNTLNFGLRLSDSCDLELERYQHEFVMLIVDCRVNHENMMLDNFF